MNPRRARRSESPEPDALTAQQPHPPMEVEAVEIPVVMLEDNRPVESGNNDIKLVLASLTVKAISSVMWYPVKMARFLIQMGYEPFYVRKERNFMGMGRESYLLLNNLAYVKYIYEVDGISGCYRGFLPFSAYQILHRLTRQEISYLCAKFIKPLVLPQIRLQNDSEEAEAAEAHMDHRGEGDAVRQGDGGRQLVQVVVEDYGEASEEARTRVNWVFFKCSFWHVVQQVVSEGGATILCYPLRALAFLSVSEFVGQDGIMSRGLIHGVSYIFKTRGISALYGGLVPKLIGDSLNLCLIGAINFGLSAQYHFLPRYMLYGVRSMLSVLSSGLSYPFEMVSVTMAICKAGFRYGRPPYMARYDDWRDCWTQLANAHVLTRGSGYLFRYYTGPVNAAGNIIPTLGINIGPDFRRRLR